MEVLIKQYPPYVRTLESPPLVKEDIAKNNERCSDWQKGCVTCTVSGIRRCHAHRLVIVACMRRHAQARGVGRFKGDVAGKPSYV